MGAGQRGMKREGSSYRVGGTGGPALPTDRTLLDLVQGDPAAAALPFQRQRTCSECGGGLRPRGSSGEISL